MHLLISHLHLGSIGVNCTFLPGHTRPKLRHHTGLEYVFRGEFNMAYVVSNECKPTETIICPSTSLTIKHHRDSRKYYPRTSTSQPSFHLPRTHILRVSVATSPIHSSPIFLSTTLLQPHTLRRDNAKQQTLRSSYAPTRPTDIYPSAGKGHTVEWQNH